MIMDMQMVAMRVVPMSEWKFHMDAKMNTTMLVPMAPMAPMVPMVPVVRVVMSAVIPAMLPVMRFHLVTLDMTGCDVMAAAMRGVTIDGLPCMMGGVPTAVPGFVTA